jgi:hypothetical protein
VEGKVVAASRILLLIASAVYLLMSLALADTRRWRNLGLSQGAVGAE